VISPRSLDKYLGRDTQGSSDLDSENDSNSNDSSQKMKNLKIDDSELRISEEEYSD
jgi:hypothetical protein